MLAAALTAGLLPIICDTTVWRLAGAQCSLCSSQPALIKFCVLHRQDAKQQESANASPAAVAEELQRLRSTLAAQGARLPDGGQRLRARIQHLQQQQQQQQLSQQSESVQPGSAQHSSGQPKTADAAYRGQPSSSAAVSSTSSTGRPAAAQYVSAAADDRPRGAQLQAAQQPATNSSQPSAPAGAQEFDAPSGKGLQLLSLQAGWLTCCQWEDDRHFACAAGSGLSRQQPDRAKQLPRQPPTQQQPRPALPDTLQASSIPGRQPVQSTVSQPGAVQLQSQPGRAEQPVGPPAGQQKPRPAAASALQASSRHNEQPAQGAAQPGAVQGKPASTEQSSASTRGPSASAKAQMQALSTSIGLLKEQLRGLQATLDGPRGTGWSQVLLLRCWC